MDLTVETAGTVVVAGVAGFLSEDESVSAGGCALALGVGRVAVGGASGTDGGGGAGLAGARTGHAAVGAVEILSGVAGDGLEDEGLADSVVVFVGAGGAGAAVDGRVEDGVEGTHCTASLEGELVGPTRQHADSAAVEGEAWDADTLESVDDLVGATGVAVAIAVQEFVALALGLAESSLENFAGRAAAAVGIDDDHASGADRTETVEEEAVGELGAGGAGAGRVGGVAGLADALPVLEFLVGATVGAAVGGGLGASGTDGAGAVDASESGQAGAGLGVEAVLFVGAALLGADSVLVGVVANAAVAVARRGVVGRVDGTGHAVPVADEVVAGTLLAQAGHQSEARQALAGVGRGGVGRVLAADVDTLAAGRTPVGPRGTLRTDPVVVREVGGALATTVRVLHRVRPAGATSHAARPRLVVP